ncbi:MAG: hypothetical protein K2Z81_02140 [Cyanobacteria bacterium]|nr:hypothetical protein [Cyanobacteriota bacterium]
MRRRSIGTALMLAIVTIPAVYAQVKQQVTPQQVNRVPTRPSANARRGPQLKEFQSQNLDKPVALPNVPDYSGEQAYMSGMIYPNNSNGPGYFMVFNTRHKQDQVKDWWLNALRMHKWNIGFTNATTVTADSKEGSVSIQVAAKVDRANEPKKTNNMNGSYTIFYSPPPKLKKDNE